MIYSHAGRQNEDRCCSGRFPLSRLWAAHHFICHRQKCCLPDDFSFWSRLSNRHIYRILRVDAEVRLDQSCRTPNNTKKRIKSLIVVVVSFSYPLACDSSSLRFVSFFLLVIWSCVCVLLPFLCCSFFFFVFDLRLLLASGTAIFLAEAHREGKVLSPSTKASLSGSCCQVDPSAHRSVCRPTFSNRMALLLLISRIGFSSWWFFDSVWIFTHLIYHRVILSLLSNYHCWSSRSDCCWTTGKILLVNWEIVIVAVSTHVTLLKRFSHRDAHRQQEETKSLSLVDVYLKCLYLSDPPLSLKNVKFKL